MAEAPGGIVPKFVEPVIDGRFKVVTVTVFEGSLTPKLTATLL